MTDREMINVISAHENGEPIQISIKERDHWLDCEADPEWDFRRFDYRIKPLGERYRPYRTPEEFIADARKHGEWIKHREGYYFKIPTVSLNSDFDIWLRDYTWQDDGSPCGIKEE